MERIDLRYDYWYMDKDEYRKHPEGLILWGVLDSKQFGVAREIQYER